MRLLAEGEIVNELPMSPAWFGIIALMVFAILLAATMAFRSLGHRHDPAALSSSGHGSTPSGGSSGH
jgi:hypothetical protein